MSDRFDAVVVGAGQSGPSLAVRLAQAGRKTAIIERKDFGGTCVNTGCTPTKALVASARVAHLVIGGLDLGEDALAAFQVHGAFGRHRYFSCGPVK